MSEWIKVKDHIPPREPILTTDGKEIHVAYPLDEIDWYTGAGESCHMCGGQGTCRDIVTHEKYNYEYHYIFTYWMPQPQLPNKD